MTDNQCQPAEAASAEATYPINIGTSAYLHQFNHVGSPQTLEQISERCQAAAVSMFKPKAADGTTYMGAFDLVRYGQPNSGEVHPLAITSAEAAKRQMDQLAELGLNFVPWLNLTGKYPEAERNLVLSLLRAGVTTLELDVEPFPGFYTGRWADLIETCRIIKAEGGTLWVDLPITYYTVTVLPGPELAAHADLMLAQSYWVDMERSYADQIAAEARYFQNVGTKAFGHILPWNGVADYGPAVGLARQLGAIHIGLYLLDQASAETLAEFRAAVMAND